MGQGRDTLCPVSDAIPVTFVSPHAVLGGAESVLRTVVTRLGTEWVAGIVVLQDGPLVDVLRSDGFAVDVIPTGAGAGMASAAFRLRRTVARQRPAVVHANGLKAALVASLALAGRATPLLWMKHDLAGDGRLAHLAAYRSDLIVGVSRTTLRTFPAGVRARTATVYNGLPDREIDRAAARSFLEAVVGAGPGDPIVVLAGRICVGKGQHELLAVLPTVLSARPDAVFALIGGEDPAFPGHADELRRLACELGVAHAVRFVGRRDDVVHLMAGSDLVAVPSVLDDARGWREGFGLVGAEALQVGTPVVGYASGALPEVLGDAAVLVAEGDRDALGRAILGLLDDPERRTTLAARGRLRVAEHFALGRSVDQLSDQYRMLARSRR